MASVLEAFLSFFFTFIVCCVLEGSAFMGAHVCEGGAFRIPLSASTMWARESSSGHQPRQQTPLPLTPQ